MLHAREPVVLPDHDRVVEALRQIVGNHVLVELTDQVWLDHCVDYIGVTGGPAIVVQPANDQEVSQVVIELAKRRIPWVIQGANTGLVQGSVPGAQVIISLLRIVDFELHEGAQATVGAGLLLGDLNTLLKPDGFKFGVALPSNPSLGGMACTNAGGLEVIHRGMMRRQIIGVTVVLPTGEILVRGMDGLPKNNTGPDLAQMVTGAEGMLGIITHLRVRIVRIETGQTTAIVAVDSMSNAVALTKLIVRQYGFTDRLRVLEIFDESCRLLTDRYVPLPPLFGLSRGTAGPGKFYLLVEVVDPSVSAKQSQEDLVEALLGSGFVENGVVAEQSGDRANFWGWREGITDALRKDLQINGGILSKNDVAVALDLHGVFYDAVRRIVGDRAKVYWFGHHGDFTIHLQLVFPEGTDAAIIEAVVHAILLEVKRLGGSVSSEHGIGGSRKVDYLDEEWLDAIDRLRNAWDPLHLCNRQVFVRHTSHPQAA